MLSLFKWLSYYALNKDNYYRIDNLYLLPAFRHIDILTLSAKILSTYELCLSAVWIMPHPNIPLCRSV